MTTIVYRDGVLAADSRGYGGSKVPIGSKCKIARLADGSLVGVSSTIVGAGERLTAWFADGANSMAEKMPDKFEFIRIAACGQVFFAIDNLDFSGPLNAPYYAIGSGNEYALGALAAGANAIQACAIACELDVWTGLPIYATSINGGLMPKLMFDLPLESFIWLE